MSDAFNNLAANALYFVRMLRELEITVGTGRTAEFLTALDLIDLRSRQDVYYTARALLLQDINKLAQFDLAFDLFWRRHRDRGASHLRMPPARQPAGGSSDSDRAGRAGDPLAGPVEQGSGRGQTDLLVTGRYSSSEILRQSDFAELSQDELDQVDAAIRRIPIRGRFKTSRRFRSGKGRRIDLRGILRTGARHGGEWLKPSFLERAQKLRNLLVLIDISGSMRAYSERYLQLCYALVQRRPGNVEVFSVGTRLTRLTVALQSGDYRRAIERASSQIPDWGGGTRIGENLRKFNREWAGLTMGSGPITIMISDGWDRGDIDLLTGEIARLSRISHSLWWLNPLMESPGFELATRALREAEPYVDTFLPAGNLASLEGLMRMLETRFGPGSTIGRALPVVHRMAAT